MIAVVITSRLTFSFIAILTAQPKTWHKKKQEQKQKYMNTNYENKNDNNYEKYRGIARPSLRK